MKRLIIYFTELLATLKSIDAHLAVIEANTAKSASAVASASDYYSTKAAIRTVDPYR